MTNTTPATIATTLNVTGIPAVGKIADAFGISNETEVARVAVVMAYGAAGYSVPAMIADARKRNRGNAVKGFSRSTVYRYAEVAAVLAVTPVSAFPAGMTPELIIPSLVTVANYGGNVKATIKALKACKTLKAGTAALARLVKAAAMAADERDGKAVTTGRKAGTPNAITGAERADDTDGETDAPKAVATVASVLANVATADLITALTARLTSGVDAALIDAIADLAATAEATVTAHWETATA